MVPPTRRYALRTGAGLLGALAGCLSRSGPGDDTGEAETTTGSPTSRSTTFDSTTTRTTNATTRTETTTTVAADPSTISPSVSVVSQASNERPAIVELGLRNDGDVAVPVAPSAEGGLPLEYFPVRSSQLVLYPTEPEHVHVFGGGALPETPEAGCWRFPSQGNLAVDNLSFEVRLQPGETYAIRHRVYYDGDDDACFAPGTYGVIAKLHLAEQMADGPAFDLIYRLAFGDAGVESVSVDGP